MEATLTSHTQDCLSVSSDPASGSESDSEIDTVSAHDVIAHPSLSTGYSTPASSIDHGPSWHFGTLSLKDSESIHPAFKDFFTHHVTHSAHYPHSAAFMPYDGPTYLPYTVSGGDGFPHVLEPERRNLHAVEFLMAWSSDYLRSGVPGPTPQSLGRMLQRDMGTIRYSDLRGDHCDFQRIDWSLMGVTRNAARQRRLETFENYFNVVGTGDDQSRDSTRLPIHGKFFRFRRTDALDGIRLAHFQLRDALACPSRTLAYYPTRSGINCVNPLTGHVSRPIRIRHNAASFTSLTAGLGVLMAGTLNGSYFLRSLDAPDDHDNLEGVITRNPQAVTNHMELFRGRESGSARVGVCSNDKLFRVMDIETQTFVSRQPSVEPCNSSALSKDGRLRAMMGDFTQVLIHDANSGTELQKLSGHRDYGFAAAWSEDGWTLATGNQDKTVCIWDSRKWGDANGNSTPVTTIRSEMAGVRSLRFSPLGSGKPVLVAAEEADFVSIIDAQTYKSKQTVDVFGAIGGIEFTNEGRDLNVLCSDPSRGALLQFERCGLESEPLLDIQNELSWGLDSPPIRDPRRPGFSETARRDLSLNHVDGF